MARIFLREMVAALVLGVNLCMGAEQEMGDARTSHECRLEDSSKEQNPFFRNKSACSLEKHRKC